MVIVLKLLCAKYVYLLFQNKIIINYNINNNNKPNYISYKKIDKKYIKQ